MEKDAFYFPHFCNARNDRKIKRLRKELGIEGYGIFFMVLEVLREQTDYKYPIDDIDLLADEFCTSEQKVRTVVTNYDLFRVDSKKKLFSAKLITYLQPMLERREKAKVASMIRWDKYKAQLNQDDISNAQALLTHSSSNAQAMQGKERKGKESIIRPDFISEKSWNDLLTHRKEKRASRSKRAIDTLTGEIEKAVSAGFSVDQCIDEMVNRNWTGFKAEWMENSRPRAAATGAKNCPQCEYLARGKCDGKKEKCTAFIKVVNQ